MEIDIIGTAAEVSPERVEGRNVAVIDVFRATSVMVTALGNGAREIIPMTGIEESFRLRDRLVAEHRQQEDPGPVLLGGERNTVIIEGFDLDNSPLRYTPEVVRDATIVMSTTNGTRAVNCAQGLANEIYIAALLVCAGFWAYFGLTADLSQLLTFDNGKLNADHSMLLGFAMLVGITGFTVWQIYQLVSESDR